jgi:transposase
MAETDKLAAGERRFVTTLLALSPPIARAVALIRRYAEMVKDGLADRLKAWIDEAEGRGFKGFATSLRQDYDAVHAALSEPWSTGPVEGHINRLKVIKRDMYGRAPPAVSVRGCGGDSPRYGGVGGVAIEGVGYGGV